ncbi:MAG: FAD-dependent monooxygenase, partial [Natronospirillum sp.]
GMVGASLALALRSTPYSVALVDPRAEQPEVNATPPLSGADFTPRVSALSWGTEQWLRTLGVWQGIAPERIGTYDRMQVWDAEGSGELDFRPEHADLPYLGHIVENAIVENVLWSELRAWSELHLFSGERVDTLTRIAASPTRHSSNDHWQVELASGQQLTARLVLIADGARSPTRDQLSFITREWEYQQQAIVTTVTHQHPHQTTARQAFHRKGPLAFLPLSLPHVSSIVWSLDNDEAERFLAHNDSRQANALRSGIGGLLGDIELAGPVASFPLRQRHAVQYHQPGAALLGDAAHSIHPLAGQGGNLGLKDAAALATALTWAAQQRVDLNHPLVLRRYARARQSDNLIAMAAMEGLKRLFTPSHPLVHWVR